VNLIADIFDISWQLNDFSSDSKRLFILVGLLVVLSFIISLLSFSKKIPPISWGKFEKIIQLIAAYYLAWILLKYGLDKIFKCQFYLPEPNILYSRVGDLDKDILFWSSIGSSYSYNIFMGIMEVIPALFLLSRRTRLIGGIIATGVFMNVIAINFGFDISVKLYASFLLLIAIYISWPGFKLIIEILVLKKKQIFPSASENEKQSRKYVIIKSVFILFIFSETFFPYIKSGNFNDDTIERPFLHGAYEVEKIIQGKDTLIGENNAIRNIFFHRDNYLIFQFKNEEMLDFKMKLNPSNTTLTLFNEGNNKKEYAIAYSKQNKTLRLTHGKKHEQEIIICEEKDWRKMPLTQSLFHWSVD